MSSEKITLSSYMPIVVMAAIILLVQVFALLLAAPMLAEDMVAFEDPTATSNSLYYIGVILVFTFMLLVVIKKNMKWIIQIIILLAVASTLYYVLYALLSTTSVSSSTNNIISILFSAGATIVLYKFPEWYVIDVLGLMIGAGAAAIFGISLAIIPTIVLLVLLAVYDAISVYKTKHMIALADGVMDLKLPILFVIPKHFGYSFRKEKFDKEGEKEAFFMGLGDAVMPTILVVSAYMFIDQIGPIHYPALGAMIGTVVGFFALGMFVMKGKPQAGLPFLNSGVILGYIAGCLLSGSPLY
ncbi:MAG: presenilin family intramembrane aspartyl protease PSH [Methanosarcinaceae archaeon]|nr:presenilin family intramembrane aspartyl protease PSH [Methanosarcinaceae archaeon]